MHRKAKSAVGVLLSVAVAAIGCRGADVVEVAVPPGSGLRYVIYYNGEVSPLSAVADSAYTHVIISFLRAHVSTDGSIELVLPPKMEG